MAGKGPTLADGRKHDCEASGCRDADGTHIWPVTPVHLKWLDVTRAERTEPMVDNLDRKNVTAVALLALSDKEVAALKSLAEGARVKNYAAIIRALIVKEAKAVEDSRQQTLDFG